MKNSEPNIKKLFFVFVDLEKAFDRVQGKLFVLL